MNALPALWTLWTAALPAPVSPATLARPPLPVTALSGQSSYRILPLANERKPAHGSQLGDYELPRGEQSQDAHPRKK